MISFSLFSLASLTRLAAALLLLSLLWLAVIWAVTLP